ncbi:MAG: response regulator [Rhodobacter sp.]|nr:response regulator [Rhodobacter sp.]
MKGQAPRRILVIEDDTTLNRLLVEQLGRSGFAAQGATSRSEALERLSVRRHDLAILDLRLPDADGLTFLPELREYCPVIVLTAQRLHRPGGAGGPRRGVGFPGEADQRSGAGTGRQPGPRHCGSAA